MAAAVGEQGLGVMKQLVVRTWRWSSSGLHLLHDEVHDRIPWGDAVGAARVAVAGLSTSSSESALPKAIKAMGGWACRHISSASCCRPATAST